MRAKILWGVLPAPTRPVRPQDIEDATAKRELWTGLAEVIKYGIIDDATLFRRLERNLPALLKLDSKKMAHVVSLEATKSRPRWSNRTNARTACAPFSTTAILSAMRSRPSPVTGIICTGKPSRSVKLQLQKSLAIDTRLDKLMWIESKQSSLPQVYGQQLRYPKKSLKLLTAVKLDKKISGGQV